MANSDLVASKIDATGYGESKPIDNNETETGRAANRRVEVVIHPWVSAGTIYGDSSQDDSEDTLMLRP